MLCENDLLNKTLAIIGMGVTGQSIAKYFIQNEYANLILVDKDISKAKKLFSDNEGILYLDQADADTDVVLEQADLLIISPGIPKDLPLFDKYLANGKEIIGEIELAYQLYFSNGKNPFSKVVAITGANGKTTCVSFINDVLISSGLKVFCGGNIGRPFMEALEDQNYDVVLLELSSFQLETIKHFHPSIAVLLNIYPNHAERYKSTEDYFLAKWELMKNMQEKDIAIIPKGDVYVSKKYKSLICETQLLDIDYYNKVKTEIEKEYSLDKFKLIGGHNLVNLNFCRAVCNALDISKEAFQKTINSFRAVVHRLEVCESRFEFQVVNDAKSTNIDATVSAIRSLQDNIDIYLIMGGKPRSEDIGISQYRDDFLSKVKKIFVIGEAANQLETEFIEMGVDVENCGELSNVIYKARSLNKETRLLFSPGFPSFDQFKNYIDRGESFKKLVV